MKHNQAFLDYRSTLPKGSGGIAWTIGSFSKAVELLAPGYVVEDGQEWLGVMKPLWLVCPDHGRYQVRPRDFLNQAQGSGCAQCKAQKCSDSAGTVRRPRASEAEKNEARKLYKELGNYAEVARRVGRVKKTIQHWCDPAQAEKHRLSSTKWRQENREQARATSSRYKTEFPHGKATNRAGSARRRKRERGEVEWCDEISGLVNLLPVAATGEDLTKEQAYYLEAERLTKETGITHHVDHIWPLSRGGPHCYWNLQVITAEENMSKGDKYRPEDQALYAMRVAMLFADTI